MAMPAEFRNRILDETESWALRFFEAFNSIGTGSAVIEKVAARGDWNSSPERKITASRADHVASRAPDADSGTGGDGKDYSD